MTTTFKIKNGDVVRDESSGRPITISGAEKLSQDLKEAAGILIQPNGFGFGLVSVLGKVEDPIALRVEISRLIRDGIASIQRLQERYHRNDRSSSEKISRLVNVVVMPLRPSGSLEISKTTYAYRFDVLTQKGVEAVQTTGTIIT